MEEKLKVIKNQNIYALIVGIDTIPIIESVVMRNLNILEIVTSEEGMKIIKNNIKNIPLWMKGRTV